MVYLSIDNNTIQLLALSKTLLGQYNISNFSKKHATELIKDGQFTNVDLVASSIKEAFTAAQPQSVNEKSVFLVLPQEAFVFGRFSVPSDMSEAAIDPFIQDKARSELGVNMSATYYDYIVSTEGGESVVLFYGISLEKVQAVEEVLHLLQLDIAQILPDTLAYYTLFAKTLRREKMERIVYAVYNDAASFGYLFDSLGLLDKARLVFGDDAKTGIKKKVTELGKKDIKLNRIILAGTESHSVRQDLFTKDVGAWTNPLEKIIDNFYQEYLKLIVPEEGSTFSVLKLDTCFGAFIFDRLNNNFSIYNSRKKIKGGTSSQSVSFGGNSPSRLGRIGGIFNFKIMGIFALSFILSFGIIYGLSKLTDSGFKLDSLFAGTKQEKQEKNNETVVLKPTSKPSPSPSVDRKKVKVKILNGSGIVGKANEVKDVLIEKGYTDIVTGNADNFDYETSEIQVKEGKNDIYSVLADDLSDLVDINESSTLEEDDPADVVFIIGKDIEGTSEAEPTEEPSPTKKQG